MGHAHAQAETPLAGVRMVGIRNRDGRPRGGRGGPPPCPDECSTMWPPIGPPECRPTPARWLRTTPRGRVRLDRGILEEPSRNRRPRAHRDLRPQYSCHFQDSQRQPIPVSPIAREAAKTLSTARPIRGPPPAPLPLRGLLFTPDEKQGPPSRGPFLGKGRNFSGGAAGRD